MLFTLATRCLAVALVGHASHGAQSYLLRRQLVPGATDTYEQTTSGSQSVSMPNMGRRTVPMEMGATFKIKTVSVNAGKSAARLSVDIDYKQMKLGMPMAGTPASALHPVAVEGKLTSLAQMTIQNAQLDMSSMGSMSSPTTDVGGSLMAQFPEKRVSVGESWDVTTPRPPVPGLKITGRTRNTLKGTKTYKGKRVLIIVGKADMMLDMDMSKMKPSSGAQASQMAMMAQMKAKMNGTVQTSSTAYVDPATGKTLEMRTTIISKIVMDIAGMNMKMPMDGKTEVVSILK
jgi:hypothetical protein